MSVVVEFMIPADAFAFGAAMATEPPLKVELERIVRTGDSPILYAWVSQGDLEDFERSATGADEVRELTLLDEMAARRFYRIDWDGPEGDLIQGIEQTEGAILKASGAGTWTFQLRFPNDERLSAFYNFVSSGDIALDVGDVFMLAEDSEASAIDLTVQQREALTMAVRRGFYKVPRSTTLAELAEDLGVSNQAASERIRRGTDSVLRPVLLGSN